MHGVLAVKLALTGHEKPRQSVLRKQVRTTPDVARASSCLSVKAGARFLWSRSRVYSTKALAEV